MAEVYQDRSGFSLLENLEWQLKRDEGLRLYAYPDTEGLLTIGYGRLIDKRKGGGISQEEAFYLLQNDMKRIQTELDAKLPWWRALDEPRQGVLLNMSYQMGVDGLLGFVNTLRLVKDGCYEAAADAMLKSKWSAQTPWRAARLSNQMRQGVWK